MTKPPLTTAQKLRLLRANKNKANSKKQLERSKDGSTESLGEDTEYGSMNLDDDGSKDLKLVHASMRMAAKKLYQKQSMMARERAKSQLGPSEVGHHSLMQVLEQNHQSEESTQKDTMDQQTDEPALNTFRKSPLYHDMNISYDIANGKREAKTSQCTQRMKNDEDIPQQVTFQNT